MKILFTFLTEKKTCFGPIRSLFTEFFYQQIIVISSQNNVRKYRKKGREQVFKPTFNSILGYDKDF